MELYIINANVNKETVFMYKPSGVLAQLHTLP